MNSYKIGYSFERRVKNYFEERGCLVFRQGKSKFPDLIVIERPAPGNYYPNVIFVECKVNGYLNKEEKDKFEKMHDALKRHCDIMVASRKGKELILKHIYRDDHKPGWKKAERESKKAVDELRC